MLQPYEGRIYDGCCGSGGMFVQSLKFMQAHSGKSMRQYTVKNRILQRRLAKMNLAIRRIDSNLNDGHEDTLLNDISPILNRCHCQSTIQHQRLGSQFSKMVRWMYGVPPKGNANYAWIQHYLHHLAPQGMAGIVMSNGSLSTTKKEEGHP